MLNSEITNGSTYAIYEKVNKSPVFPLTDPLMMATFVLQIIKMIV